ncbi:MAG: glycoside hydrolase family 97 protein [Candidatus Marinimicrobia bacterium]|nr:glycoside hydrolase family 97 protein [Candidatus Neomarinimicrobiota bacterium]MCF7880247.1 glycoside hydrolase family 97 protein [Candidatus Neomarinimicrobiota bacterium]
MKRWGIILVIILVAGMPGFAQDGERSYRIVSPDQGIVVTFEVGGDQFAYYSVAYQGTTVLENSRLGVERMDADLFTALRVDTASAVTPVDDKYSMRTGKQSEIRYQANRRVFHLRNDAGNPLDIIFQVSNDGVAFRYHFPEKTPDVRTILKEYTTFRFLEETHAWIQPLAEPKSGWQKSNPSYEEHYIHDVNIRELPDNPHGWVYPALFKTGETWILISETAPGYNYCGSRISYVPGAQQFSIVYPTVVESFPDGGAKPVGTLPMSSPWRIIAIGDLETIAESTLGTDLADPPVEADFSFVEPGRASWSWVMLKDNSVNYDTQKRFIDYAAEMGWEYCLVDADWDRNIGYDGIAELSAYAQDKGVGLLLWYNSAGSWNTTPYTPRDKLLTHDSRIAEFTKLQEMDIAGIKVDFFGGDARSMMVYYQDIFTDAAKYDLVVNCHGTTLPRGWQRTYPNLVTMESIMGFEFVTFEQQNANRQPMKSCVIPFTRNVFDPMDFTPVGFSEIPNIERRTSNAFELATGVIFHSGVQHFAAIPKGMNSVPSYVKRVMKEIPVAWDQTEFVAGYPGKLAVLARKKGNAWYVAGINGEDRQKEVTLDLSFLASTEGMLIADGETNRDFRQEKVELSGGKQYSVDLSGYGGFLMKFGGK